MGLVTWLRGRRAAPGIEWMPCGVIEVEGGAAWMGDVTQVSDGDGWVAYQVLHDMPNLPGAVIWVWTYPCYIGGAGYGVGVRYLYSHDEHPDWWHCSFTTDPEGETFPGRDAAIAAAADWAGAIADRPGDWQPRLRGVFGWDGVPFLVRS